MYKLVLFALLSCLFHPSRGQVVPLNPNTDSLTEAELRGIVREKNTMVALTFGQSNAANRGQVLYKPHHPSVYNYYLGKIYRARDPLLGATGPGGSVWSLLGDMLVDSGMFRNVIFITIAIGNTDIACWVNGSCFEKLRQTLSALDSQGIKLTHIFWHQGESDNLENTPKDTYKDSLKKLLGLIRQFGQDAPFFVSLASYHNEAVSKPLGVDTAIRNAQKEFIRENRHVYFGPDTDMLIYAIHRYDGVHFSAFGMKAFAEMWLRAVKAKKE